MGFNQCSLQQLIAFSSGERADNGVVLADIDNDGEYEILIITRNKLYPTKGNVYAFNLDGSYVPSHWNGIINPTILEEIPRISVGDLNGDGNLEIAFLAYHQLYVLNNQGSNLPGFPITVTNTGMGGDGVPILADIDDDDEIEIIINVRRGDYNSKGKLCAFNSDGSECFGWPLQSDIGADFAATPFVGDIDADGYNEVIIGTDWTGIGSVHDNTTYVWDTTGDADKVEWGKLSRQCTEHRGLRNRGVHGFRFGRTGFDDQRRSAGHWRRTLYMLPYVAEQGYLGAEPTRWIDGPHT